MSLQLSRDLLIECAKEYGTPVYVYHAERIKEQYDKLLHAFEAVDCKVFYACKALTNINILKYIKSIGCHVDCGSINEVMLALKAGFEARNILYTSNSINFSEILMAQQCGVNISIDSISNLDKFGKEFGRDYPVGIRIRPDILAGGNFKISTGHENSKFGIPLDSIGKVLDTVSQYNLNIHGLNIHTGSEIQDIEVFARGIEVLFELASQFSDLKFLDLGGGFKVPYMPGEKGTDIDQLGKKVKEEFAKFEKKHKRHLQVWFEPGKFLVSEAGYFITRVNVLKQSASITFAGIDSGLNHFIRPMFYGSYHTIENISNPTAGLKKYTVVGNICETDTFAENRLLSEVNEGDYLVFSNAGAYCFEMASNYNSRFKPPEVLVMNGKPSLIRKRDVFENLLSNQVELL
jgi:diaminopimelate decarboxylase